jgi:hypothetical protein
LDVNSGVVDVNSGVVDVNSGGLSCATSHRISG